MARFSLVLGSGPSVTTWKCEFEAVSLVALREGVVAGTSQCFPRLAAQGVTG